MSDITKDLALDIVKKLSRAPSKQDHKDFSIKYSKGSNHDLYKLYYGKVWIGQFGIVRGSNKNARHNWIPGQIFVSRGQAYDLAKCPLSLDSYLDILVEAGKTKAK